MQRLGDRIVFSPSDLNHFLECEHLITLELARDPAALRLDRDAQATLLADKGAAHERAWLERFAAEGRRVVEIPSPISGARNWEADAAATEAAMRAGADVIYQGVFADGDWHGISDFLVRVPVTSVLGDWSYEAWDTKLARHAKPHFVLQLCFYTEQLARMQQVPPAEIVVVLGTGEVERLRYRDFDAYYRTIRRSFLTDVTSARQTYPYPVAYCALCDYRSDCERRWFEDDHLSQVANIRRDQVTRLEAAGVSTVAALSALDPRQRVGIGEATLQRLRHQASLQAAHRQTGQHRFEVLPLNEQSGFRLLPAPSPGDIFFDIEGDPYYEPKHGLEYLFGVMTLDGDNLGFEPLLALNRGEEKAVFERFIDLVQARLRQWPDLHVYHYAAYEVTALKRLMGEYGTREDELDDLLRREVFVDLYQVVRQSLRISHDSYSIKSVRAFFMPDAGQGAVATGGDSIVEFERWRQTQDQAVLDAIVDYNREDCVSTVKLRDWLLERKAEAERRDGIVVPWKPVKPGGVSEGRAEADAQTDDRAQRLRAMGTEASILLADLLEYHRREAKPEWWAYFERQQKTLDELIDDTEAIAGLAPAPDEQPVRDKRSMIVPLDFPEQDFKMGAHPDRKLEDPFSGAKVGSVVRIDSDARRLHLRRGPSASADPLPTALVPGQPLPTSVQRQAIGRLADEVLSAGPRYRAARALLAREYPRCAGRAQGSRIQTVDLAEQKALVATLDDSYLFMQGPPGSGKTWTGARLIVSLMAAGNRVGVAALSHKAINNLLREVEAVAVSEGLGFTGLKKCGGGDGEFDGRFIGNTNENDDCERDGLNLVAGTSWLFSRPGMEGRIDYLFIDEAGQLSLADTLAMSLAARNVVLLGDPQQLPQIRQGLHPEGAGRSALEHLLRDAATVPEDRGIFQERTFRMHPEVCRFISALAYDGRLQSAASRERQIVNSSGLRGAGLRWLPVEHQGNAQASREEADTIAREVRTLLDGGTFTNAEGVTRPLRPEDILIVAPYNMQVRVLQERVPGGVEVGTVDKFQGREAPVVFFSMASSSGEDVPRGLEFLFSRNRLNVAISRARALAVLVCCPRLLEASCRSLDQMRLVNNVCRLAEDAAPRPE
ncbi:MAG: TM0106 family RecB-like putative nuclease [Vicinamibacterales bacterium]